MDNLYLKHCRELREMYQERAHYTITENIQKLDVKFDIDSLRQEIFKIISNNSYGYNSVSLRLPSDQTEWVDHNERVEAGGITPTFFDTRTDQQTPVDSNYRDNQDYVNWHTGTKYIQQLTEILETHTGFKIGRVRLVWLKPDSGYTLHSDAEPMRLHIPIITNKNSLFIHDDKIYRMEYGSAYQLITTGPHTAHNYGTLPRLHLIFSTYSDQLLIDKVHELRNTEKTTSNLLDELDNQSIDKISIAHLMEIDSDNRRQLMEIFKKVKGE